jgi:eukaryotic-like serine/threonine-protein kinase
MTHDQAPAPADPQLLAGRYDLGLPLDDAGPLGTLFAAQDRTLNRRVAVRLIPPSRVADPEDRPRLLEAVQAAATLTHPGLAAVLDLGVTADGAMFVVTELGDGATLRETVTNHGPFAPAAAAQLTGQVCATLAALHANGLTHGAVTAGSVLIGSDGTAKLTDCGLAGVLGLAKPPGSDAGRRADLAGVGRCVYELITGQPPAHHDPDVLVAALPAGLRAAVGGALRRRCLDPAALASALRRGTDNPRRSAAPPGDDLVQTLTQPSARPRRRRLLLAAAVVAVLLLVAAGLVAAGPLAAGQPTSSPATTTPRRPPPSSSATAPSRSAPPAASLRPVPTLTGITQAAAVRRLAAAGLRVGQVYRQRTNRTDQGTVLATGPPAGQLVPGGTAVALVVSVRAGPATIAELIRLIDRDPGAVGRRGPTYRHRLAGLDQLHGQRRRAELADLLGIARAGASNGDFTDGFSRNAVAVLAPLVRVEDLPLMAAQFPSQVGPAAARFAQLATDRLRQPSAAATAALTRDARQLAASGQLAPKFAAAALEVLGRVR